MICVEREVYRKGVSFDLTAFFIGVCTGFVSFAIAFAIMFAGGL